MDHKKDYEEGRLSTTDGEVPKTFSAPAPNPETGENGQHKAYWVLSESERAKGFVRPLRNSYRHLACGTVTTMGNALAETYSTNPKFYGATFCVYCKGHFPVGEYGEFVWEGTNEKVGT